MNTATKLLVSAALACTGACSRPRPPDAMASCREIVDALHQPFECKEVEKPLLAFHDKRAVDAAVFRDPLDAGAPHFGVVMLFASPEDVDAYRAEKANATTGLVHLGNRKGRIAVHSNQGALSAAEWDRIRERIDAYR